MKLLTIRGRPQYRLVLWGHKAVEAGAVCLVLMVHPGKRVDALGEKVFHPPGGSRARTHSTALHRPEDAS